MATYELVMTETQSGLFSHTSGFGAVAASQNIPEALVRALTDLAKRQIGSAYASPTGEGLFYSHFTIQFAGSPFHLLTRGISRQMKPGTGQPLWLVHQIAVSNVNQLPAGPAWLMANGCNWIGEWTHEPQFLGEMTLAGGSLSPRVCAKWKEMFGDAGWGGLPLEAFQKAKSFAAIISDGKPLAAGLELFVDSQSLIDPKLRWRIPMLIGVQSPSSKIGAAWAILKNNSKESAALSRNADWVVVSSSRNLESSANAFGANARTGDWAHLALPVAAKTQKTGNNPTKVADAFEDLSDLQLAQAIPVQSAVPHWQMGTPALQRPGSTKLKSRASTFPWLWLALGLCSLVLVASAGWWAIKTLASTASANSTSQTANSTTGRPSAAHGSLAAPQGSGNSSSDPQREPLANHQQTTPSDEDSNVDEMVASNPRTGSQASTPKASGPTLEELAARRAAEAQRAIVQWTGPQAKILFQGGADSRECPLIQLTLDESSLYGINFGLATPGNYLPAELQPGSPPGEAHWRVNWTPPSENPNLPQSGDLEIIAKSDASNQWQLTLKWPEELNSAAESILQQGALSLWLKDNPAMTTLVPFTTETQGRGFSLIDAIHKPFALEMELGTLSASNAEQPRLKLVAQATGYVPQKSSQPNPDALSSIPQELWAPPHSARNDTNLFLLDADQWAPNIWSDRVKENQAEASWATNLKELLEESAARVEIRINAPQPIERSRQFESSVYVVIFLKPAGSPIQSLILQNQSRETQSLKKSDFQKTLDDRLATWLAGILDCGLSAADIQKSKVLNERTVGRMPEDEQAKQIARSIYAVEVYDAIHKFLEREIAFQVSKSLTLKDHHGFKELAVPLFSTRLDANPQ